MILQAQDDNEVSCNVTEIIKQVSAATLHFIYELIRIVGETSDAYQQCPIVSISCKVQAVKDGVAQALQEFLAFANEITSATESCQEEELEYPEWDEEDYNVFRTVIADLMKEASKN